MTPREAAGDLSRGSVLWVIERANLGDGAGSCGHKRSSPDVAF